jgi:hypothetical protein
MNSIPASEVKRRGVAALEEAVKKGPVHVIKNNRPTLVVLTEEEYARLAGTTVGQPKQSSRYKDVWDFLLNAPSAQTRTKEQIDADLREERASWGDR